AGAAADAGGATAEAWPFRSRGGAPAGRPSPVGQPLAQDPGHRRPRWVTPGRPRGSAAETQRSGVERARTVLETGPRAVRIPDRTVDPAAGLQAHRATIRCTVRPLAGVAYPGQAQLELPATDRTSAGAR